MRIAVAALVLALASPARAELDKPAIRKVIKAHIRDVITCYERDKTHHTTVVEFTIATNGKVTEAVGSGNPDIEGCLVDVIKKLQFPTSNSSTHVTYPFIIDSAGS